MWQELISVLSKIVESYHSLLNLSKQKRAALVSVNVPDIERLTKDEEQIVTSIGKLEQIRKKITNQILSDLKVTEIEDSFMDMLALCDKKNADELIKVHNQLKDILKEVSNSNKINETLIQQALSVVNYNINVMSEAQATPTYNANPNENTQAKVNKNLITILIKCYC